MYIFCKFVFHIAFILYLTIVINDDSLAVTLSSYFLPTLKTIIFKFHGKISQLLRQLSAEYSAEYSVRSSRIFGIGRYQFWAYRSFTSQAIKAYFATRIPYIAYHLFDTHLCIRLERHYLS